jgi:DNA-directed RNA polymerase specialized sigma24 family protein
MTEQQAIELLSSYRQKQARLQVLSSYSVGAGITISRLNEDDHLQELHRRLRGLPSYMYLSAKEQRLEATAHAYLERYPAGTRAQLAAVPRDGADEEDERLLAELRAKIRKVIAARGWDIRDDIDAVLDRLAEYQDLRAEIERVDTVLSALEQYKPDLARLLRLIYIEDQSWSEAAAALSISTAAFYRRKREAIEKFAELAG